jgi:hypothetical protein
MCATCGCGDPSRRHGQTMVPGTPEPGGKGSAAKAAKEISRLSLARHSRKARSH